MATNDLPNAKLIILFILSKTHNMPSTLLMNSALESLYMDYFLFSEAKQALKSDHLLIESVRKDEIRTDSNGKVVETCDITPEGLSILNRALPTMPSGIRSYLSSAATSWNKVTEKANTVIGKWEPDGAGAFMVHILLLENHNALLDMTFSVPTQNEAESIVSRWQENTVEMYERVLRTMCEK